MALTPEYRFRRRHATYCSCHLCTCLDPRETMLAPLHPPRLPSPAPAQERLVSRLRRLLLCYCCRRRRRCRHFPSVIITRRWTRPTLPSSVEVSCCTDHGTGGLAFVLGGSVRGGKIIGKWPGIAEQHQYQGRDLAPANDYRSLFKSVLHDHLGLNENHLESSIFPESREARMFEGLIKRS